NHATVEAAIAAVTKTAGTARAASAIAASAVTACRVIALCADLSSRVRPPICSTTAIWATLAQASKGEGACGPRTESSNLSSAASRQCAMATRTRSCTTACQKRTSVECSGMSAKPQKRTSPTSLDDVVGTSDQRRRHSKAERLGSFEVDDQLVLCW